MESKEKLHSKNRFLNIFLFIGLLITMIVLGYVCYKELLSKEISPKEENIQENIENEQQDIQIRESEEEEIEKEEPQGPGYSEESPVIDEQQAYVAVPSKIYLDEPATIVMYCHGSTGVITDDFSKKYMSELREFAIQFPEHNYIFVASNQHGQNWGNEDSVQDMVNLKDWVDDNYPTKGKIYLIGFSMGGLPTMNYATQYPKTVSKIALLAPTLYSSEWSQQRVDKVKDMDIKIWHGTADVNIPISYSTYFVNKVLLYGIEVPLVKLEGKTHFDIDREYPDEIIYFFSS